MNAGAMPRSFITAQRYHSARFADMESPAPKPAVSQKIVGGYIAACDGLILLFSGNFAAKAVGPAMTGHMAIVVALLGAVIAFYTWRMLQAYTFQRLSRFEQSALIALAGLAAMIAVQIVLAAMGGELSRAYMTWLYVWFAVAAVALLAARGFVRMRISYWGWSGRLTEKLAIVGSTSVARHFLAGIAAEAKENPNASCPEIVGIFDDRRAKSRDVNASVHSMNELIELIRMGRVDAVVIAVPLADEERFRALYDKLSHMAVDIRLCPDHLGLGLGEFSVSHCGHHTLLNVANKPLHDWRLVAKDVEDRVLGLMILALIAPLMAVIALAIKVDSPGPAFFRQKRLGYNNRIIEVLKFRSMRQDMCDANAEKLATRNDPRITRIGAFLRRTSLDELPQFINVLRGEMSIVGPRPHALAAKAGGVVYHDAVASYLARHRVKPGITGWAQINGWRGETQTVEQIVRRVEHDLFYIENWSVVMDIKIIIRTAFGGFTGKSAY